MPKSLRPRTFTRLLQKQLLGEAKDKPCFSACFKKLDLKGFESIRNTKKKNQTMPDGTSNHPQISKSAWSAWWYGNREISVSYRAAFNAVTNNLATKWLVPCLTVNRLACHFCWFDLAEQAKQKSFAHAEQSAWAILYEISKDWNPIISFVHGYMPNEPVLLEQSKAHYSDKSPPHYLDKNPGYKANYGSLIAQHYDRLNPSSIVVFLLRLGSEEWSSNAEIAEAIAVDFTSAILACYTILTASNPYMSLRQSGESGEITVAFMNFWFTTEDLQENDLNTLSTIKCLKEHDLNAVLKMRAAYHSAMVITGLSIPELRNLVFDNLEVLLHFGILADTKN